VTLEIAPVDQDAWARGFESGNWGDDIDGFSFAFEAHRTHDVGASLETCSCLKLVPFVCDQALTKRISEANAAMGQSRRAALLNDLAQTFHDDPPVLYLFDAFDVFGVSRRVEGFAAANRIPIYESIAPAQ